jgi:hypothetical protein
MNTMERLRQGVPAATITLVAGLVLSGCSSAEESVPNEIAVVWEDVEQQLTTENSSTALETYEAAHIDEKEISVDVAGLDYDERAATIANAVFEETSGDAFRATSEGVIDGEDTLSLRLGHGWPQDGTATTGQLLESASALVCTTVLANGIDIGPNDPIAEAATAVREQEGDAAEQYQLQMVLGCIGRLTATEAEVVELVVPIGQ